MEQTREHLKEILSRPEFEKPKSPPELVFDHAPPIEKDFNTSFEFVFLIGALIIVLIIVGIVAYLFLKRKQKVKQQEATTEEKNERFKIDWKPGEIQLQIRSLFQQMLNIAQQRGKLILRPSKTNGEYRQEWKMNWSETFPIFDQASYKFDEIWYGGKEVGVEEAEWFLEKLHQIEEKGNEHGEQD